MVVDDFIKFLGLSWRYSQDWVCYHAKGHDLVIVKPSTFMNKSGVAVSSVGNFYGVKSEDILAVYDEVDLPFGKMRLAFNGLSAGHHGIDSIIESLGSVEFARLRVGVGRPLADEEKVQDIADYVLRDFAKSEQEELPKVIAKCRDALNSYISDGIEATMNRFN